MDKSKSLTPEILSIVQAKGTERSYSGIYNAYDEAGSYLCRQCGLALFRSRAKFHSSCGWPSFDEEITGAVRRETDADGRRTEILCRRCLAHLGHVFQGEGFTAKNLRHCVNSASLDFVPALDAIDTEEAIFAAGCFWGVEHYFKRHPGVLKTEVGYAGGATPNPTYRQVCDGKTGHLEVIRVVFDQSKVSYENLVKYFFEIHDGTQVDGQGPDLGQQYLSAIFVHNDGQRVMADAVMDRLKGAGYKLATRVLPMAVFWPAEDYHQDYYGKTGKEPYCHRYQKIDFLWT